MSHLIVKVCHQGEIKRVAVNLAIPLDELRVKLATLFNQPTGTPVVLKYLDDENDLITLSQEEELQEAVRLAQKNNLVLRVHMFLPNQPLPAADFKVARTGRADVPSLLSSQLPVLTNSIAATALSASASSVSSAPAAASSAPVLSVIVVERHYLPISQIGQRTAAISTETSALVEKNAAEVSSKTAHMSDVTSQAVTDVARKTQANVELLSQPSSQVTKAADQTVGTCESVSEATSAKVSALADVIAVQMSKQAEHASQANAQNAELNRHWAIIASDTASRVDELSAALVQRLLSL